VARPQRRRYANRPRTLDGPSREPSHVSENKIQAWGAVVAKRPYIAALECAGKGEEGRTETRLRSTWKSHRELRALYSAGRRERSRPRSWVAVSGRGPVRPGLAATRALRVRVRLARGDAATRCSGRGLVPGTLTQRVVGVTEPLLPLVDIARGVFGLLLLGIWVWGWAANCSLGFEIRRALAAVWRWVLFGLWSAVIALFCSLDD
jgi:hypothetical protein